MTSGANTCQVFTVYKIKKQSLIIFTEVLGSCDHSGSSTCLACSIHFKVLIFRSAGKYISNIYKTEHVQTSSHVLHLYAVNNKVKKQLESSINPSVTTVIMSTVLLPVEQTGTRFWTTLKETDRPVTWPSPVKGSVCFKQTKLCDVCWPSNWRPKIWAGLNHRSQRWR